MTHIATSRINELIGVQIGIIQEEAQKLDMNSDLQAIDAGVAALEKAVAALKDTLTSIPHEQD